MVLRESKDKPQTGRKSLQNTCDRGLVSRIGKELLRPNNKKTQLKNGWGGWVERAEQTPHQRRYTDGK